MERALLISIGFVGGFIVTMLLVRNSSDPKLDVIIQKLNNMATKLETITALIQGINEDTNNIAADLERIAGGLTGGLTSDEADGVIAELQTAADKLKAVADINPEA